MNSEIIITDDVLYHLFVNTMKNIRNKYRKLKEVEDLSFEEMNSLNDGNDKSFNLV